MNGKYVVRCIRESDNKVYTAKIRFDSFREEGSYTYFMDNASDFETIIPTRLIVEILFIEDYRTSKKLSLPSEVEINYLGSMKWEEAKDQLKTADFVYNNTDLKNRFLYKFFIKPLAKRYEDGERTDDLYNKIMEIEM